MLSFRRANIDDAKFLFDLRNDAFVRKNSFKENKIKWEEHLKWLEKKMKEQNCCFLIMMINGQSAGQIRFDIKDNDAEISIAIVKFFRGKGYGSQMVANSSVYFFENYPHIETIIARIKEDNIASVKIFRKAGYIDSEIKNGIINLKFKRG